MTLSWNEIKDRALRFAREWATEESEDAEAQTFLNEFFNVFGVSRRRFATFETKTKKLDGKDGYIDLLWKGKLLVEQKSRGKDLQRAYKQATDYFPGLKDHELPRYILVSDFARFRLFDLDTGAEHEFQLKDLPKQVKLFGFLAGYTTHVFKDEDPVNVRAAERMGVLHDELKKSGFEGHALELLLVRMLFCLFADDTGIFPPSQFHDLISNKSREDGSDLGPLLGKIFQALNTLPTKRQSTLDEDFLELPYVNGRLFGESLPLAEFTSRTRELLLEACILDWSEISPAIFGALFQSVMDPKLRRNLGAHYTSEKNIFKLIRPLFLDDLKAEIARIGHDQNKLKSFHAKLAGLKFLDPACGCGNFLVISYRELRLLETEVLRRLFAKQKSAFSGVADHVAVNVDQFYGIEIEEFPAQIAQVAMWLMDHQMNQLLSDVFDENFARLPLIKSATVAYGPDKGNALRIDWNSVVKKEQLNYILGNPPFVGHHYQSAGQKVDQRDVLADISAAGVMDFVSCWFWKAAEFAANSSVKIAFVATNSICQGEQVGLLWAPLIHKFGMRIAFAHQTFRWSNEAREKAAVHCIIVGFWSEPPKLKRLFQYDTVNSDPVEVSVENISPYLVSGADVLLQNRSEPICDVPRMAWGSKPTDGGNLILSPAEREAFLIAAPEARKFLKRYIGAEEFLNGGERWCLWLTQATPHELRSIIPIQQRISAVKAFREASSAAATRGFKNHHLFRQIAQPSSDYLLVPGVSSERREYVPIGFMPHDVIANNLVFAVPNATLYHFGILESKMHMSWMRYTCGRLESRYRYSKDIVYNNFPWPEAPTDKQKQAIEQAAQGVLDARAKFPKATLADLYDPLSMPPELVEAHQTLDRAVDAAYGKTKFKSDAERVAFLFELYQKYTSLLPAESKPRARKKKAAK